MIRLKLPIICVLLLGLVSMAPAQTKWKIRTKESSNSLCSVVHAGTQWVAVGIHGVVLTSQDGEVWMQENSPTTEHIGFLSVAWSGSMLVACGYGEGPNFAMGTLHYSEDGKSWTEASITPSTFHSVVWSGNRFVAVGDGGEIYYSNDGKTWKIGKSETSSYLNGIGWNGKFFIAVGVNGTVLVSPDAENWARKSIPNGPYLCAVAWAGDKWIAIGDAGRVLISIDGESWSQVKTGETKRLNSIARSGDQMLVVGDSGTIITSQNGDVWKKLASGTTQNLYSIAYNGGQSVIVGESNMILSSAMTTAIFPGNGLARKSATRYVCSFMKSGMILESKAQPLNSSKPSSFSILGTIRTGIFPKFNSDVR